MLSELSQQGVNLVAVTAVPFGPTRTQLTIFADDTASLQHAAQAASIPLDGPHPALVVQGDDEVGALAQIHEKLRDAKMFGEDGQRSSASIVGPARRRQPEFNLDQLRN